MKLPVYLFLIVILFGCSENKKTGSLTRIPDKTEKAARLTPLLSEYRMIPLETNEESLIGNWIGKIRKYGNHYYISCDWKELIIFDEQGKYLNKIAKQGAGPQEYLILGDFDVRDSTIAISDKNQILFYDLEGNFLRKFPTKITPFNITLTDNGRILVYASGAEYAIYLFNQDGKQLTKTLKSQQSTRMGRNVRFWRWGNDKFITQIGWHSNDLIVYDQTTDRFYPIRLLDDERAIDSKTEETLVKQYKNYTEHTEKRIISDIASCKDRVFLVYGNPGGKYNIYSLDPKKDRIDVIFPDTAIDDVTFDDAWFSSQGVSDDSFLAMVYPSSIQEGLKNHPELSGEAHFHMLEEYFGGRDLDNDNPVLFDIKFKQSE